MRAERSSRFTKATGCSANCIPRISSWCGINLPRLHPRFPSTPGAGQGNYQLPAGCRVLITFLYARRTNLEGSSVAVEERRLLSPPPRHPGRGHLAASDAALGNMGVYRPWPGGDLG